ncbi:MULTISPECIES: hypothetical protein [unclassified Achromobacter]|uniref:hypothetical protein n=1 Tax=unclassified Achromobacter TaxID=2626865 RepID=UPI0018E97565|nr:MULTISPECIES: hypothetical protein [unclassified Achromobacter]
MKETETLPGRWVMRAALLASAACAAGSAHSDTPAADAGCAWPVAGSVEALLQAETEVALRARRGDRLGIGSPPMPGPGSGAGVGPGLGAGRGPGPGPDTRSDQPDRVAVAAIYGVGRRLHVDVRINGQLARYRKGQRWPEHAPSGGAGVYALAAVLGECVRLQSGTHAQVTCLDAPRSLEERRN